MGCPLINPASRTVQYVFTTWRTHRIYRNLCFNLNTFFYGLPDLLKSSLQVSLVSMLIHHRYIASFEWDTQYLCPLAEITTCKFCRRENSILIAARDHRSAHLFLLFSFACALEMFDTYVCCDGRKGSL